MIFGYIKANVPTFCLWKPRPSFTAGFAQQWISWDHGISFCVRLNESECGSCVRRGTGLLLRGAMLPLLSSSCKTGYAHKLYKSNSSRASMTIPGPASEDVPLFLVAVLPDRSLLTWWPCVKCSEEATAAQKAPKIEVCVVNLEFLSFIICFLFASNSSVSLHRLCHNNFGTSWPGLHYSVPSCHYGNQPSTYGVMAGKRPTLSWVSCQQVDFSQFSFRGANPRQSLKEDGIWIKALGKGLRN